jgi:hypothetical protein
MNARTAPTPVVTPPAPRFDRKFIEEHRLLERYLDGKLPVKGARDLENWCRANPEYLNELKLADRAQTSLKLLEASGAPLDLNEPPPPWWRHLYVLIALAVVSAACLVAFWSLYIKYQSLTYKLTDTRTLIAQGPLVQPSTESAVRIAPDHAPNINHASVTVSRAAPQLMDVHVDMSFTKLTQFRLFVDKKDQGRALILNNLTKDSNNDLRFTFNSSGLSAGTYTVRIEGLPFRGAPLPLGWMMLEVH